MNRATKFPLAGVAWMIVFAAVLIFSMGYKAAAQEANQQLDVQPVENNNQPDREESNRQKQDQESKPEQNQQEGQNQNQEGQQADEQGTYDYVAQPGDSYTLMARKAVQTYGLINDVDLSIAEIVYAETQLTKNAGEPELEVGQSVQFQVSEVAQAVRRAQGISEEVEALWDFYAQQVPSFNTDNVGEGEVKAATDKSQEVGDGQQVQQTEQEEGRQQDSKDQKADQEAGSVQGKLSEGGK